MTHNQNNAFTKKPAWLIFYILTIKKLESIRSTLSNASYESWLDDFPGRNAARTACFLETQKAASMQRVEHFPTKVTLSRCKSRIPAKRWTGDVSTLLPSSTLCYPELFASRRERRCSQSSVSLPLPSPSVLDCPVRSSSAVQYRWWPRRELRDPFPVLMGQQSTARRKTVILSPEQMKHRSAMNILLQRKSKVNLTQLWCLK